MDIKLSDKSQSKVELPTFGDIKEYELFALERLNQVHLFMKMPRSFPEDTPVIGDSSDLVTVGYAYCLIQSK